MKTILTSGKRKTAIARAVIREGSGRVIINKRPIEQFQPEALRMKLMDPLVLAGEKIITETDIRVNVRGGGFMGQCEAARTAISRALVSWTESEELRAKFIAYDRHMLVGDPRQKEPKKFGGPGARAKYTKSYR